MEGLGYIVGVIIACIGIRYKWWNKLFDWLENDKRSHS